VRVEPRNIQDIEDLWLLESSLGQRVVHRRSQMVQLEEVPVRRSRMTVFGNMSRVPVRMNPVHVLNIQELPNN